MEFACTPDGPGAILNVRVTPRARRTEVAGTEAGGLGVRVTASPVDGAVNAAAIKGLAQALGVTRRRLSIEAGQTSRDKRVRVRCMDYCPEVERALNDAG